jgi:16S rRNA (guanine527-N7)-methyltransferase
VPDSILDVGSGVGLPGIPLAIAFPDVEVVLLDRSGRRSLLLRRVTRILGLENTQVLESDVERVDRRFPGMTFRASLPPPTAMAAARRLLEVGGRAVLGLSRSLAPDEAALQVEADAAGLLAQVVAVPTRILDSPAWLLRISAQ